MKAADDEGVDAGNDRGFGRRRQTRKQAVDDQEGHRQRPEGTAEEGAARPRHALPFLARKIAADGDEIGRHHHRQPHQDARNGAGKEHLADRNARERADDDHRHRGRDDRPDRRGRGGDGGGEIGRVARLLHAGDHHAADRGGIGDGGACEMPPNSIEPATFVSPSPPRDPADEGVGEPDDAAR